MQRSGMSLDFETLGDLGLSGPGHTNDQSTGQLTSQKKGMQSHCRICHGYVKECATNLRRVRNA